MALRKRKKLTTTGRDPFNQRAAGATGNHPTNNIRAAKQNAMAARNTQEAYSANLSHGGRQGRVTLPPVRWEQLHGANRQTKPNVMDTQGHGGYRARLNAEAIRRYGSGSQSLELRNKYIQAGMDAHSAAQEEVMRRKYNR